MALDFNLTHIDLQEGYLQVKRQNQGGNTEEKRTLWGLENIQLKLDLDQTWRLVLALQSNHFRPERFDFSLTLYYILFAEYVYLNLLFTFILILFVACCLRHLDYCNSLLQRWHLKWKCSRAVTSGHSFCLYSLKASWPPLGFIVSAVGYSCFNDEDQSQPYN